MAESEDFQNMKEWFQSISRNDFSVPMVLVGNTVDDEHERTVNRDEALALAYSYFMEYFETDARLDTGIQDLINHICEASFK